MAAIDPAKIKQIEGATYYVSEEPTLAEIALFPLPVNFKIVNSVDSTYKMVSFKADGTRLELTTDSSGGATNVITEDSDTVAFTGNGTAGNPLKATSNLTLEQARQNGNVLEGDVEFYMSGDYNISKNTNPDDGESKTASLFYGDIGNVSLSVTNHDTNKNGFLSLDESSLQLSIDTETSKGFTAITEFNKQGDRKAFAQLSDVYDANSYSTTETLTGGTWYGSPIYRKIVSIRISPDFPILEDYINLETFFPGIVNVVHSSFVTDREDFGGAISYTNSVDGLFNWEISKIFGESMKLTGRKYDGTFMDLNDMYGVIITLEYNRTTD